MTSAVLPNHEATRLIGFVIGGNVDGDLARCCREDLAVFPFECLEGAFGNVGVWEAFGSRFVMFGSNLSALLNASINEDAIVGFGEIGQVKGQYLQTVGTNLDHITENLAIFTNNAGGFLGEGCPGNRGAFDLCCGAIVDEGFLSEVTDDFAVQNLLCLGIHRGGQGIEQSFG